VEVDGKYTRLAGSKTNGLTINMSESTGNNDRVQAQRTRGESFDPVVERGKVTIESHGEKWKIRGKGPVVDISNSNMDNMTLNM